MNSRTLVTIEILAYLILAIFSSIFIFHLTIGSSINPTEVGLLNGKWVYYFHSDDFEFGVNGFLLFIQMLLSSADNTGSIIYEFGFWDRSLITFYWALLTFNMAWLINLLSGIRSKGIFNFGLEKSLLWLTISFILTSLYKCFTQLYQTSYKEDGPICFNLDFNWLIIFLIVIILFLIVIIKEGALLKTENDLTI